MPRRQPRQSFGRRRSVLRAAAGSVVWCLVAPPACTKETFPLGWNVDVAARWTRRLKIVGEVGAAYRNLDLLGTRFDLSVHTFMAGPRLSGWQSGRLAPFAHIPGGVARVGAGVVGEGSSTTVLALNPARGWRLNALGALAIAIVGGSAAWLLAWRGKDLF